MTHYDRPTGYVVHRLDSERLLELGKSILELQYGVLDDVARVESLVLVKTNKPSVWGLGDQPALAVVCSEGVGWDEDSKNGLVSFWVDFGHYGSHALEVKVHPRVIEKYLSGETVELGEFIRNHNDRLESNFDLWKHAISKTEQVFEQKEVLA